MKTFSLFLFIKFYCIYRYTSIEIKPELKKHSLPPFKDLKFSKLNYDNTCAYLDEENGCNAETKKYTLDLLAFCKKIEPYVDYYRKQIRFYHITVHQF